MKVQIITDSACDMPEEKQKKYHIQILPLYVTQDETLYRDGIDIHPDEIYRKMAEGVVFKTSQIPYTDYFECFEAYAKKGQPVLYLSFSSGLSGTFQTARLAQRDVMEKYPGAQIGVTDTKAVLAGLGMIVEIVGRAAAMGADMESLIALSECCSKHIHHIFTVADLEYLYRGGRLNKGTALIGNALKIRPFLIVDPNGELKQIGKARGEKRLLKMMIAYMGENGYDMTKQPICVEHAADLDVAEEFIKMFKKAYDNTDITLMTVAPVIGTHLGPGSLTAYFFDEPVE